MAETPLPLDAADRLHRLFQSEQQTMLGRIAVGKNLITEDQLRDALAEQSGGGARLGEILVTRGWIFEPDLALLLDEQRRIQTTRLTAARADDAPPEVRTAMTDPARVIDEFVLVQRLGGGGTGEVWKSWDRSLRRWVAVKRPTVPMLSAAGLERFHREARAAARLTHANIVPIYHVGASDGRPYIVMHMVEGRTLGELRFPPRRALEIVRQAALAVAYAHRHGVVHRDLKPGNIMLDDSGCVWLLDFGLAHLEEHSRTLTAAGTVVGTPAYMSPEQARGESGAKEPATDVYALGATLYELVTGQPPFLGNSFAEIIGRVSEQDPIPPRRLHPSLPVEIETIILKALDKDPKRRYESADALAEDMRRHLEGEPIAARPSGWIRRAAKRVRRNLLAWGLGAAAVIAAVSSAAFWLTGREHARRMEVEALRQEAAASRLETERSRQRALLEVERDAALKSMRSTAATSVETALRLRRKGITEGMDALLPGLEESYRLASERAPALAELDFWMGRMMRALMEDARALEYQERALSKDPEFAPALYERIVLNGRRYSEEAQKGFDAIMMRGGHVSGREDLERANPEAGRLWGRLQADALALNRLVREGRAGFPRVGEAHVLAVRGILAFYERDFAVTERTLEEAVQADPTMEEAWEILALCYGMRAGTAADPRERERLWDRAEDVYTRALSHDRGYLPHLVGRACVYNDRGVYVKNQGGDPMPEYVAGEADLTEAIRLRATHAKAYIVRGWIRTHRGTFRASRREDPFPDFKGAEEDLTKALDLQKDSVQALLGRAMVRSNRGLCRVDRREDPIADYDLAESDLLQAVGLDRANSEAWLRLGVVRFSRGNVKMKSFQDALPDFDQAIADLGESIRLNHQNAEAWMRRGYVRWNRSLVLEVQSSNEESRKEAGEAAEDWAQAMRLNPGLEKKLGDLRREALARAKPD